MRLTDKTTGVEFAEQVRNEFATSDPEKIATRLSIAIETGAWEPVTAGEFNWAERTIRVNLRAQIGRPHIVAHELGHYFLKHAGMQIDAEKFCEDFAKALLKSDR